jgi:hypothetical protein
MMASAGKQRMSENPDPSAAQVLAELARLKDALALLGVRPCSSCKKFYRRTDPGALFDADDLICYACIPQWWPQHSAQLVLKDRETIEGKLVFWLRDHHRAEVFKDPAKLPETSLQELHIVATCLECRGAGKSMGQERCRFCEGRGTVWVIVSRKQP